jgi:hypothetical protein
VLLENCHCGTPKRAADGKVQCDMNLFRTSGDIRPTYGSILTNLRTVDKFNKEGLTGPGCWVSSSCIGSVGSRTHWLTQALTRACIGSHTKRVSHTA